jgi:hypothetical protein
MDEVLKNYTAKYSKSQVRARAKINNQIHIRDTP